MGLPILLLLCRMEARAWHTRLTQDRKPGEKGMPMYFIRGITGAQALDRAKAMGLL